MVPRHQIAFLTMDRSLKENLNIAKKYGHTRFPLVESDLDSVFNYVHIKDLFWIVNSNNLQDIKDPEDSQRLREVAREIVYVPEGKPIDELLKEFQQNKAHLAVVADEYGGVSGLVTLEDILEELVGEIQDEFDREVPKVQNVSENTYIIDGSALMDELQEQLDIKFKNKEDETIGGYVLTQLGRLAQRGDVIEDEEFRVKVLNIYRKRVAQVKLTIKSNQKQTNQEDSNQDHPNDYDVNDPANTAFKDGHPDGQKRGFFKILRSVLGIWS